MRLEKKIKIGECQYTLIQLSPYDRNILFFELVQLIGSATPTLEGGIKTLSKFFFSEKSESILDTDLNSIDLRISDSLQNLLSKLEPKKIAEMIKEYIVKGVVCPNLEDSGYDEHFQKFYQNQWPLILEILDFNFDGTCEMLKKIYKTAESYPEIFKQSSSVDSIDQEKNTYLRECKNFIWSIVFDKRATLQEIETFWSYHDVLYCYYLSMQDVIAEYKQLQKMSQNNGYS